MKIELVEESRRGLRLVGQALTERQRAIEESQRFHRAQLDRAFDDDARSRSPLTADWIIDARKAYAVGIDALHRQADAGSRAHAAASENVAEIDRALQQLQTLHRIEQRAVTLKVKQ